MKAIVSTQYGGPEVMQLTDIETPTPADGEVLLKIHATAANAGDWHLLRAEPFLVRFMFGLRKPSVTILGAVAAGTVAAVGSNVQRLKVGDPVFGDLSTSGFGGFAEYVTVKENALALKPDDMTFEQAAAIPSAAVTALQALRKVGNLQPGENVLINGASGGVGMFAVQIAKALGAEVTAVASTRKLDMVRSLGADHVIDYKTENFTQSGKQYDLIHAANGYHPIGDYKRALKPDGRYVMSGGKNRQLFEALLLGGWMSRGEQSFTNILVEPTREDLEFMVELFQAGKVTPVIDKSYPLSEVPEAIRYLEAGQARGKVIINVV